MKPREMPERLTFRLLEADRDWWAVLAAMPPGVRSQAIRDALRLVLAGPQVLRDLAAELRPAGDAPRTDQTDSVAAAPSKHAMIADLMSQFGA